MSAQPFLVIQDFARARTVHCSRLDCPTVALYEDDRSAAVVHRVLDELETLGWKRRQHLALCPKHRDDWTEGVPQ